MEISQSFLASRTSSGSGTVCLQELLTELTKMMNVMAKYQHDNDDDGKLEHITINDWKNVNRES